MGGLSIFEPINRFGAEQRVRTYGFADVDGVEDLLARVVDAASRGEEETGGLKAMVDFDERDLLRHAEDAGFGDIRLTLLAEITTEPMFATRDWRIFLDSAPNPLAPTFAEAMEAALTTEEAERLTAVLRPQIEAGQGTTRMARAFLNARRPA